MSTHSASEPTPATERSRRDESNLLSRVLLAVETLIPCDRALIWLIDEKRQILSTVVGRERGAAWNPGWTEPIDWPVFAPALRDDAFVMLPREQVPGFTTTGEGPHARHILFGPIRDGDRPIGVLSLSRMDDRPFTETNLQTLQTIAGLASIAVRASLAIESERQQRQRVMQASILTAALNQARTPAAVIDVLLRGVVRQGIEHCYVALIDPGSRNRVDIHLSETLRIDGRAVIEGLPPEEQAVEVELMRTRRHVSGSRLRELLEIPPVARPEGMHGLAAVPIRNGTRLDGVLYLWSPTAPDDPAFTDLSTTEIDAAETLCAQAAVALERTVLQQQAQQTAREQRALADFSGRLSSAMTSEEMADAALQTLASMMPIACGRVTLVTGGNDAWSVLATFPGSDPTDESTCEALHLLERWVQADTAGWSGPLATWMEDGDSETHVLCWPVASDETAIGALTILRHGSVPFAQHEFDLASHTGGQLALGLQRARSHADAIIARDEAERNAGLIARMLHIANEMSRQLDLEGVIAVMDAGLSDLVDFSVLEIYTADEEGEQLDLIHYRGIDDRQPAARRMPFGSGAVGRAARLRRPAQGSRLGANGRTRVLGVPMVIEGQLLGVITLGRDDNATFTEQELSLLGIFSAHAASEISRADLARRNRELYLGGIRALTSTVDAKDPHTRGHSARVGRMARLIAERMDLPREDIERVELAGLLHDVGKVAIPDLILQKSGPLDQEERAIMMGHTEMGAHILSEAGAEGLEPLVPLVLHHHEWWDGRGYPHSLRGSDIPLGARIIAVADAFDTMTHDRPYRKRSNAQEALAELQRWSGTQFAPAVVEAISGMIDRVPQADDETPLASDRLHPLTEPLARTRGQLGDLRSLGILVGLVRITSHMTDLASLIERTLALLAERLDMSLLLILSPGERRHASVEAYSQGPDGHRVLPSPGSKTLDALLSADLPSNLESIEALADLSLPSEQARSPANAGVVALRADDEVTGALIFEPNRPECYWRTELQVIEAIVPHVAAAVNVARMHEQAKWDALTDGLTGALNYRAFQQDLARLIEAGDQFAVLMFDVVGLKPLNDTIGHLAGDQLLRHSVEVIRSTLGEGSVVGRIGGDEFGALLVGDDSRDPREIGRRIIERMEHDVAAAYQHTVTLRFGWAVFPLDGRGPELLLHVADQRMYLHRPSGRDTT